MNRQGKIKQAVSVFQDWFQRTDHDLQDEMIESFRHTAEEENGQKPNRSESIRNLESDFTYDGTDSSGISISAPSAIKVRPPTPIPCEPADEVVANEVPPRKSPKPARRASDTNNIPGLKIRQSGDAPAANEAVVQNKQNDTVYNERNETVSLVHQRYAKYGHTIASAVLSKAFAPNGLRMLLDKLDLKLGGSELGDHDQIVHYIDKNGLQDFCAKVAIRFDADVVRSDQQKHSEQERRRLHSEANQRAAKDGTDPYLDKGSITPKPLSGEQDTALQPQVKHLPQVGPNEPAFHKPSTAPQENKPRRVQEIDRSRPKQANTAPPTPAPVKKHEEKRPSDSQRRRLDLQPRALNAAGDKPQTPPPHNHRRPESTSENIKQGMRGTQRFTPVDLRPTPLNQKPEPAPPATPRTMPSSAEQAKSTTPQNKNAMELLNQEFDTSFDA